jgi:Flp pilus assembly pilin Flp
VAAVDQLVVLKGWVQARLGRRGRDERGANLVEYLLLVSLIAIAVIGAVAFLGSQLSPKFSQAGSSLSGASGS